MDMVCPPHFEQVKTSSADGRREERPAFPKTHLMIAFVAVLIHLPSFLKSEILREFRHYFPTNYCHHSRNYAITQGFLH